MGHWTRFWAIKTGPWASEYGLGNPYFENLGPADRPGLKYKNWSQPGRAIP